MDLRFFFKFSLVDLWQCVNLPGYTESESILSKKSQMLFFFFGEV